ncbi:hypothetical protein KIN20_026317, partial [Parelaphostrongylus tenuis]
MLSTRPLSRLRRFIHTTVLAFPQPNFKEVLPPEETGWAFNHIEKKRGLYKPKHTIEEQIAYMNSKAFQNAYQGLPIYRWYRRNFKGQAILQPPPRLYCIDRYGRFNVNHACPVCRDEYLFFDFRNPALIEQFLSDGTHQPIDILKKRSLSRTVCYAESSATGSEGTWWNVPEFVFRIFILIHLCRFQFSRAISTMIGINGGFDMINLRARRNDLDKEEANAEDEKQTAEKEQQETPLSHPPSSVTKQSIMKNHESVDFSSRKFQNPVLAYVTPWNNKGYDLAKWVSHKLTHVSPVWIQLKPQTADMSFSCRILGTHDIDH